MHIGDIEKIVLENCLVRTRIKLLHARVIAVVVRSAYLPDGLLIASDTQRKHHLLHFTSAEFADLLNVFLNDLVRSEVDGFVTIDGVIHTDKVYAKRD